MTTSAWSNDTGPIRGAGSTYVTGAYTSWAFSYSKEKNVNIQYQPTGSGDGIRQIIARTVDFAATDFALSPEELKKHDLVQFPTLVSGVVPVVNLPGIRSGKLRLTGPVLHDWRSSAQHDAGGEPGKLIRQLGAVRMSLPLQRSSVRFP